MGEKQGRMIEYIGTVCLYMLVLLRLCVNFQF